MPYDCILKPGEIARIPLGFGLIIPDGFAGYVFPRSSMAAKGLVCELPPIDSGYRGEIHAIISNVRTSSQTIHKDTRVGQLVITPVVIADFSNIVQRLRYPQLCIPHHSLLPLFQSAQTDWKHLPQWYGL